MAVSQDQVTVALDYLHAAARQGDWLCIKNLHLMTYWLPALEKELKSLQPHENFRLWLTAEVHPKFSAILARSCLNVTYEVLCYICALMLYHEKFSNEIRNNNYQFQSTSHLDNNIEKQEWKGVL